MLNQMTLPMLVSGLLCLDAQARDGLKNRTTPSKCVKPTMRQISSATWDTQ